MASGFYMTATHPLQTMDNSINLQDNHNGHERFFTTSRGHQVTFLSIAPLLDKLEAWRVKQMPKPPTYTPKTAEGIVAQAESHFYRMVKTTEKNAETGEEKIIEREETSLETPEEWEAWRVYERALRQIQAEYALKFLKTILLRGIDVITPTDDAWVQEQEFMGYEVPTHPLERKWHWLQTELASDKNEYERITLGVLGASGVSEEVISQMEATFLDSMG